MQSSSSISEKQELSSWAGLRLNELGLNPSEVESQRLKFGRNIIVEQARHPLWSVVGDSLKDPMLWLLLGVGALFAFLGETREALVLGLAIIPILGMDAYLHRRTEMQTQGLRKQLAVKVRVRRNGENLEISAEDLVPGDLVFAAGGEVIAADGILVESDGLQVDEAILTGESLPVPKSDKNNRLFAGTRVLSGSAQYRVFATGLRTRYGEVLSAVKKVEHERTGLQKSMDRLLGLTIVGSVLLCLFLAYIRWVQGHGWIDAILSAATLAVAAIPEEFPVALTFYLGVGVYRLAQKKALVKRAVSVENIGRVSVICTDKTGTLTVGVLTLNHVVPGPTVSEMELIQSAATASDPAGVDPVDVAILENAKSRGVEPWRRDMVFPFTEERRRETAIYSASGENWMVVKGAPETILSLCELREEESAHIRSTAQGFAKDGHKVLACARRKLPAGIDVSEEPKIPLEWLGILAFEDPSRPEVPGAIALCKSLGVHVIMLTGDHPETAKSIARDVGLGGANPRVISVAERSELLVDGSKDWEWLRKVDVLARCNPLQKLMVVEALKSQGEIVSVTGDGVNDVPALKAADVGIAMGIRGSSSAKEVASIVLADDNFATIVTAIFEGRRLFDNLKMSFQYLILVHIPLVVTAAFVPMLGNPLVYMPIHIAWLELVIHPTALLAFHRLSGGHDNASLKKSKANAFLSLNEIMRWSLYGIVMAIVIAGVFVGGLNFGISVDDLRFVAVGVLTLWSMAIVFLLNAPKTKMGLLTLTSPILLLATFWLLD